MRRFLESKSGTIAFSGILSAGSLAVMMFACMLPVWRTGWVAVSGLFPMVGVLAAGRMVGYSCWFTTGVLALLLLPDKGLALAYLLFLGVYPVLKEQIESIRKLVLEWCLKLLYFNLTLCVLWFAFRSFFLNGSTAWMEAHLIAAFFLVNVIFLCYDFLLSHTVALLRGRLK